MSTNARPTFRDNRSGQIVQDLCSKLAQDVESLVIRAFDLMSTMLEPADVMTGIVGASTVACTTAALCMSMSLNRMVADKECNEELALLIARRALLSHREGKSPTIGEVMDGAIRDSQILRRLS